jgi:SAM-dependent methyltransferase
LTIGGSGPSGYDAKHFSKLAEVEDQHFWFAARNRLLSGILRRITVPDKARVLEVGAGTGNTLRVLDGAFPSCAIVGVDLFDEGFRTARLRTDAHLVRAKIEQLPFRTPFDVIGAFDVLEHVEDDRAALIHLHSLLAPEGHLVLTVPAFPGLWSRFDEDSHHFRRYERQDLHERLLAAGYIVDRITYFFAPLYPLLRVGRWTADRAFDEARATSPVARELRVVPMVNGALKAILDVEARAVVAGVTMPFGTSLLAIARPCESAGEPLG